MSHIKSRSLVRLPLRAARLCVAVAVTIPLVATLPASATGPGLESAAAVSAPLISGTASYVKGTYVYTDYAYDDTGANSNPALPGGGDSYPASPYPGNAADIIRIQLGTAAHGALQIGATLNTMLPGKGDALVGIGFDTDRNAKTGAASLPGGRLGSAADPLGLEKVALLGTDGRPGTVLTWNGTNWTPTSSFRVAVDNTRNTISAVLSDLTPGTSSWNVVGAAGYVDGGGSWLTGAHPIMDLAFVKREDPVVIEATNPPSELTELPGGVQWQDRTQAEILAGQLSASQAVATVHFGTGATRLARPVAPGLNTYLYRSSVKLEGSSPSKFSGVFGGLYQPYLVMLLSRTYTGSPVINYLHGVGGNHLSNMHEFISVGASPGSYNYGGGVYDVLPASPVIVFPMGRDLNVWSGASERDALDAVDDAVTQLHLDANRIVLTGNSQGGLGTFNIGHRFPDRWAGAYSAVGNPEDSSGPALPEVGYSSAVAPTGGSSLGLENMTDLPFRAHNGLLDPLGNVLDYRSSADALDRAGTVDYQIVENFQQTHATVGLGSCWYLDLLARSRVRAPGHVRFTLPPVVAIDGTTASAPNGAYWVSGMAARRGADTTSIDVRSGQLLQPRVLSEQDTVENNYVEGRDYCGPNPAALTHESWRRTGRTFGLAPASGRNSIEATMVGLDSVTLDTTRMKVSSRRPVLLDVTGDGATKLTLAHGWEGSYRMSCGSGPEVTLRATQGNLRIDRAFFGRQRCSISA